MADVHVFAARSQPATRFVVEFDEDRQQVFEQPPRSLVRCRRCNRRRWAERCVVQVYYDGCYFWCADKARCKPVKRGKRKETK